MNKREKIHNEIEKTLNLFEKKDSLPTNPYFYTRVQQRLNEKSKTGSKFYGFLKPALLTGLFAINIGTVLWHFNSSELYSQVSSKEELTEVLTSDLNLGEVQTDLFNLE